MQTLRESKLVYAQAWNTLDSSDSHLNPYDAEFLFKTALRYLNDGSSMVVGPDPLVALKVEPVPDSPNTSRVWVCERLARSWGLIDGEVRLSDLSSPTRATYLVTVDPTGGDAWTVESDSGYDMSCDGVSDYPTATFDPPLTPEYVQAFLVNLTPHDVVGPGGVRGDQDVEWVEDADGIPRPVVRSPSPSS